MPGWIDTAKRTGQGGERERLWNGTGLQVHTRNICTIKKKKKNNTTAQ